MVFTALLLSLASALTLAPASASPTFNNLVVHEHLDGIPDGFVHKGLPSAGTVLNLRIALVSNNLAGLETALYDVSTPSSPLYGQHLSKEEVEKFVAPTPETTKVVNDWLASNGLKASPISPAGDWLSFSVDVNKANELLAADFTVFTHQATGEESIRTLSYSIPAALENHLDFVHPTIAFPVPIKGLPIMVTPLPSSNISANAIDPTCASTLGPVCLQELYGIPTSVPAQTASQIAVSGFNNQFAQFQDFKSFIMVFRPDLPSSTSFAVQTLDGGSNTQGRSSAGIEANLDIQYTGGLAGGVPATFISVGSANHDGIAGFLDITNFLISEPSPPRVFTTSYGFNEPVIPSSIGNSLCNAYMQLGARGVSILFASGDGGVSGIQPQSCTTFVPSFPSGCPFVTSVGGTTGIAPETSVSFSGGGFSNLFARPAYQAAAVSNFLHFLGNTNAGLFNTGGRAFPDIAAQAQNLAIFNGVLRTLVSGTSCSSPIIASVIAMINAELIAAGKPALGFLNPFIYANEGIFTDITVGSNPGCGTNGFPAGAGWDPVTGVGTPNFASLRTAVGL